MLQLTDTRTLTPGYCWVKWNGYFLCLPRNIPVYTSECTVILFLHWHMYDMSQIPMLLQKFHKMGIFFPVVLCSCSSHTETLRRARSQPNIPQSAYILQELECSFIFVLILFLYVYSVNILILVVLLRL